MRISPYLVAALVSVSSVSAYASCNLSNPSDPENDCDGDGCKIGAGGALDCNDSPDGGIKQHSDTCVTANVPNTEVCDGIDNNCSGATDEGDPGGGAACSVSGAKGICIPGVLHCVAGAVKCVANTGPQTETCDGLDNDCDGLVDEDPVDSAKKINNTCFSGPGTAGVGLCKSGVSTCNAAVGSGTSSFTGCIGEVVATNPPANPESGASLCDGLDNDCDGTADDGNPGGGAACSTGLMGVCAAGTQTCHGAMGVKCDQNTTSSGEVCDGLDNDCDGSFDENASNSGKLTGSCYTGANGTAGVGPCKTGLALCDATAGAGSAHYDSTCTGQVTPVAEICDTVDNDCNGVLNNGNPGGGAACASGKPGICGPGKQTCNSGGTYTCVENIAVGSQAEICDAQDNDCDGQTDEQGTSATQKLVRSCFDGPGTAGTGICKNGQQACNATVVGMASYTACSQCGATTCTTQVVAESPPASNELLCDNRDEDCDGTKDDGFNLGAMCTVVPAGTGICAFGTNVCKADKSGTSCQANTPVAESCNGLDDNCNGSADEGDPGGGGVCNTGLSGVCAPGVNHCTIVGGVSAVRCIQNVMSSAEICDGLDNNCNGRVDENITGGGIGNACDTGKVGECQAGTLQCQGTLGIVCVQNTASTAEICDNKDNNCNGQTDEGAPARKCYTGPASTHGGTCPGPTCVNVGECKIGLEACDGMGGYVGTCVGEKGPTAEVCDGKDNDCNGSNDNGLSFDVDNDMSKACGGCNVPAAPGCDCNDNDATIKPTAVEICDAIDNNCNGKTDENSSGTVITRNCYSGPANTPGKGTCVAGNQSCNATTAGVESYTACIGEVKPTNPPDAGEVFCNGLDDDCDGVKDDGFDQDNDSFVSCALCGGYDGGPCDCNDSDFTIKPGAVEACDTTDQNCDGRLDDVPPRKCFSDSNGMNEPTTTYTNTCPGSMCLPNGECKVGTQTCSTLGAWGVCGDGALGNLKLPSMEICDAKDNDCDGLVDNANFDQDKDGFTSCAGDCNDADPAIHPGAAEVCDNKDNDCDGTVDGTQTACYSGAANTRGLGICRDGTQPCTNGMGTGSCMGEVTPTLLPDGGVPMYLDGGFNEPEVLCNNIDDDCDGIVDDGFDLDGDGQTVCQGDCDDRNPFNKKNGIEVCDCQDNNCNTTIDDGNVCVGAPCHDFDHDGFTNCQGDCDDTPGTGNAIGPNRTEIVGDMVDNDCDGAIDEDTDEDGDGYSTGQGDCDDHQRDVNPGALEKCDGFDNNCDKLIDEGFDKDKDGVSSCAGDCNDNDPKINQSLLEVCGNGKDDNCDGRIDEEADADGDGVTNCQNDCNDFNPRVHGAFGAIAAAAEVCDGQDNDCNFKTDEGFDVDNDGVSSCFGDCNDNDPAINPYQVEVPGNGKDDNCNGMVDEGELDRDGDGFTPICGDCNDSDPTVNPHAKEVCDRVDNNCDGYVDSARGVFNLCAVCFDADGDGQTNCDGDCNDADKAIYRGAPEICDGKDNDCDGMLDLDPVNGLKVCREDAGVPTDGGLDAGVDAGTKVDAGPGTVVPDGGPGTTPDVVVTQCGCGATDGFAPLALIGLALFAARRRRSLKRAAPVVVLALAVLVTACTPTDLKVPVRDGGPDSELGDGGKRPGDGGRVDAGHIVIEPPGWKCPGLAPIAQATVGVPTTDVIFAYPDNTFTVTEVLAANAELFDDATHNVAVGILVRDLPAGVDPLDPTVLDSIASREISGLDNLQGTPLVRERTERFSKVYDDDRMQKNFSTSQTLSFSTPTNAFSVRNRLVANFSQKAASTLGTLPVRDGAVPDSDIAVSVFFRVTNTQLFIGFAVTPLAKFKENQTTLADLTNGSHLSGVNANLTYFCEKRVTPALKTDFIFVMDNTPSTVVWRAALENASDSLFAAFQNSGLDFRIGVVTTDSEVLRGTGFTANIDSFKADLAVGLAGNTNEMGIEYGLRAIDLAKLQTNPDLRLREGAGLVVIFMSDEDNHGTAPVSEYVAKYKAENAVAFAIVGPRPLGCTKVGYALGLPGDQYITLANQTGGSSGSICNENVSEVIEEIVLGALGASSRSMLDKRPVSASLSVRSEAAGISRSRSNGFDYEPGNNSVLFFGKAAPKVGAPYDAAYAFFQYIQ